MKAVESMSLGEILIEIASNMRITTYEKELPGAALVNLLREYRDNPSWQSVEATDVFLKKLQERGYTSVEFLTCTTAAADRGLLATCTASFDWRLNAWEKHVENMTFYLILTDDGELKVMP